jgi:TonB family protein
VNRNSSRAGFVASAVIHSMVLLALMQWRVEGPPITPPAEDIGPPPEPIARIRFPPPEVLRPPGVAPARPAAPPEPVPTPRPQPETRDRVSIGGPAPIRQTTPLVLRRDQELTRNVARGRPDAPETGGSPAPTPEPAAAPPQPSTLVADGVSDLPLAPPGSPARVPRAAASASPGPSIAGSLRHLEERLAAGAGSRGIDTGTGQQMGPLFFDPQGADFTAWANHFKNEVYRNWIVPPSVTMGIRGHVEIEFRIERDGTMSALRIARPSGTEALDRAARNALLGSRALALPADYAPASLAITVTFFYNETGAGS